MVGSCKNIWRHRSFCASGWPAILLIKLSSPFRRSSMKFSSNKPSSPRNGICRFQALPGNGGTTIYKWRWVTFTQKNIVPPNSYLLYCHARVRFLAIQNRYIAFERLTLSLWILVSLSGNRLQIKYFIRNFGWFNFFT